MKIKILEDAFVKEVLLFDKNEIELEKVTLLLGGNSVGKSSLLKALIYSSMKKDFFKRGRLLHPAAKSIEYLYNVELESDKPVNVLGIFISDMIFNNESLKNAIDKGYFGSVIDKYNQDILSEGQGVFYSIYNFLDHVNSYEYKEDRYYILAIDEIDSGLSLDNVRKVARKIKNLANKFPNLYIILSFNNYEFMPIFKYKVFDMYIGEWRNDLKTYDQFSNYIIENSKDLEKRRKRNMYKHNAYDLFIEDIHKHREKNYKRLENEKISN